MFSMNYTVLHLKMQARSLLKNKKGGIDNYAASGVRSYLLLTLRCRVYAHLFTGLVLALKLHHAVDLGKERIITSLAHVLSGMYFRAPLTDNDRPCVHLLAVVPLHTEVLGIAVSSIS